MSDAVVSTLGCLRGVRADEVELMLAWRNAPSVRANMYTRHEITLTEHLAWWDRIKARADQRYFMYEFKGDPVGIVAFNGIDMVNKNSSWAFYASPESPRGTGSRMEFLALDYAFLELELHKLSCEVLAFNSSVIRLHEKFGFKVEGVLREQHYYNDHYVDIYRLGMISFEWKSCRDTMLGRLLKLTTS